MTVPLPSAETVNLTPPDADEVRATACGVASAVAPTGALTDLQRVVIEALFPAMTGHSVDMSTYTQMTAEDFAAVLARRDLQFRTRGVQIMLLCAFILRPLPEEVVHRIADFARELGVEDGIIDVAREFADGAFDLAAHDFERNGYTATWKREDATALHTSRALQAPWDRETRDPELAARWLALQDLPEGTLGRRVWELYDARGFVVPGLAGSAPPLLAQHDWVHVLADYGTTVECELEVFAFIARANDDPRGFSLLAMVISLFETGYLRTGAGLFEASPGHLSAGPAMAVRLADAMRRGARGRDRVTGRDSIDYLRLDWFSIAALAVEEARERFSVEPKSDAAVAAGSVGPWEPGGLSPFQEQAGRSRAEAEGRLYRSYGATSDA
jgi:hypothetical protein